MSDEKRTLIAIVMMALILLVFFSEPYQRMMNPEGNSPPASSSPVGDGTFSAPSDTVPATREPVFSTPPIAAVMDSNLAGIKEVTLTVQTPLLELVFSSRGGGTLQKAYLHDYFLKDSSRVQLITEGITGNLSNQFLGYDVENYSTADMPATCSIAEGGIIKVNRRPVTVEFTLPLDLNSQVVRKFTFYPDSFHFDLQQQLINLESVNAGRYFATSWRGGIAMTEPNRKQDLMETKLYALLGDEHDPEDYDAKDELKTEVTTGLTRWVGVRSKYFAALMIPASPVMEFSQTRRSIDGDDPRKIFNFDVRDAFDRRLPVATSDYRVYLGPLDYDIIRGYGLYFEEMMTWGWFGFLGKWALRVFKWMHNFIPNYGLVIIIFSVLIKVLTAPLTQKQMASTQKMQLVQPQVAALKEKYKNDAAKLNQETMKLYKEMGVNPAGGCLPLLIQMPILIAMFRLIQSTIELRGAAFLGLEWWMPDLSMPDTVATVMGFAINPLPIIMALTMFLQQKLMTPSSAATNPQMKMMTTFMPFMLLFIFYRFPSGLNLYYTMFNVMSILQQKLMPTKPADPKSVPVVAEKTPPKRKKPRQ